MCRIPASSSNIIFNNLLILLNREHIPLNSNACHYCMCSTAFETYNNPHQASENLDLLLGPNNYLTFECWWLILNPDLFISFLRYMQ